MHAVFLDYETMGPGLDLEPLSSLVDTLEVYAATDGDEIAARIRGADIVFTNKLQFDAATIASAQQLKFIGLTATGADNIDLVGARSAGVVVSNIQAYCTQSVMEHVMGFLLMLAHRLDRYADYVSAGHWQRSSNFSSFEWPVTELRGKTLGIVGYGELGRSVASAAETFGMQVLVAARPGQQPCPAGRQDFLDVLAQSNAISLHCPLNAATRHIINDRTLAAMRPGAWLINTSRGGLIDSAALAAALAAGHIGGAALDVLPQEPPTNGDPLLEYAGDNLIITPHTAWSSVEARQNAIVELAKNTRAFLAGKPRNQVSADDEANTTRR